MSKMGRFISRILKSGRRHNPINFPVIFVHLAVWVMLFVVLAVFTMRQNQSIPVSIVSQFSYAFILFYLNYLFITPRFLLPKKYFLFSISIVAVFLVSFFLIDPFIHRISLNDLIQNAPEGFVLPLPSGDHPGQMPRGERFIIPRRSIGMFFLVFAFLTFSSSVRIYQKLIHEENLNKLYQHEKLNAELMMLRQQVNPHFLFNSLNNILSLANRKSDLTSEAIVKLSTFMRYMLKDHSGNDIPVMHEIDLIRNYIDLQKLWTKNSVEVDFQLENVDPNFSIEPFILNPLVENAFKYGVFPGIQSKIHIHLQMIGDWLNVWISNPVMLEKLSEVNSMGIGVNNVISRLELCYQGNYRIENNRRGANYEVNLSIKLRNNELYSNR